MKIVFDETKFNVNEEKNVVTCVIKAHFKSEGTQREISVSWGSDIFDMFTVHGCAKCHPEDKFSIEIGKRIAESRAKKRIYQKGFEISQKISHYIDVMKSDISKLACDMKSFKDKEDEHIDIVMKDVEPA